MLTQAKKNCSTPSPCPWAFLWLCHLHCLQCIFCKDQDGKVKWEGDIRLSDPKLFAHGLLASPGLWLHVCLLFSDMSDAVGCSAAAPAAQGVTDGHVSGREGSQQEKLGKLGLPMQPLHRGDHYLLCSRAAPSHSNSQSINSCHPFGNR